MGLKNAKWPEAAGTSVLIRYLGVVAMGLLGCSDPVQGAVLRVGTTGDYLPFTRWPDDASVPSGTDPESAERFAAESGVQLRWVRTGWPTLMDDLLSDRFDVAWSGITVTDERAAWAAFSRPYASGGKQAVVRCGDAEAITRETLAAQRFMVNPGGTNESFLRTAFPTARVTLERDNLEIFNRLERGDADVMVTDSFEARFQTDARAALCIGLDGALLTEFDIAVLGPKGSRWLRKISDWIARSSK